MMESRNLDLKIGYLGDIKKNFFLFFSVELASDFTLLVMTSKKRKADEKDETTKLVRFEVSYFEFCLIQPSCCQAAARNVKPKTGDVVVKKEEAPKAELPGRLSLRCVAFQLFAMFRKTHPSRQYDCPNYVSLPIIAFVLFLNICARVLPLDLRDFRNLRSCTIVYDRKTHRSRSDFWFKVFCLCLGCIYALAVSDIAVGIVQLSETLINARSCFSLQMNRFSRFHGRRKHLRRSRS